MLYRNFVNENKKLNKKKNNERNSFYLALLAKCSKH